MIINTTIKAWRDIRKLEGLEGQLASVSPVWDNIDFCPGTTDRGFESWKSKVILTVGHLYDKDVILSFSQLFKKYDLSQKEFFRFLQIQSSLNSCKNTGLCYQSSPLEKIVTADKRSIMGLGYEALIKYDKGTPAFKSRDWINDLSLDVDEATWKQIWESANNISVCNRTRETQFRPLHRLQITPQFRHKLDNDKSELCSVEVGSFIHCAWTCRYIDRYWHGVVNRMCLIFDIKPK